MAETDNNRQEHIAFEAGDIARRKDFLEFSEKDAALLRQVHEHMARQGSALADTFYHHLSAFPELQRLLRDEGTLKRLKQAQGEYFSSLTAGDYGPAYVENRLRIGMTHQRIGLAPQWYIGAYRKYLSELMPILWDVAQGEMEKFGAVYDALLKIVSFDMGLALDTYIHAGRQALYESEERFRIAFGQAAVGLAYVAPDGRWLRVNRKLQEIVGYSEAEMLGMGFQHLTHEEDLPADLDALRRLRAGEAAEYIREKRYIRKDGGHIWVKVTVAPVRDAKGAVNFISVIEDVSNRKRMEEKLQHLASHDSLTGLPNRELLHDRLSQAISHADRAGKFLAVMLIDLDRFKNINDSLGHEAGDKVIVEAGRRLSAQVRGGDTVARFGGDEFVVLLSDVAREEDIATVAHKILEALREPMVMQGQELTTVGSIGISVYPKDGTDGSTLIRNADAAMYRAKEAGRGNMQFYAHEMNARTLDRLKTEVGLRHALERGEFVLHYQPQLDTATGEVVGVEALLRWMRPQQGIVPPADFIPIAEETGLIMAIGEWVLHTACAQQRAWDEQGFGKIRMAVNLSARQFRQVDLDRMVAWALEQTGCPSSCLELEITESVIMENPETATVTLRKLSDMGVQLAIDDFGTGYSSLSYLKRFPIHKLKIDQSFVTDITADADDAAIAKAVIALAHSMKLKVIAEGVETAGQLEFLREQQCDQLQGYYFSRPVPPEKIPALLGLKKLHEK